MKKKFTCGILPETPATLALRYHHEKALLASGDSFYPRTTRNRNEHGKKKICVLAAMGYFWAPLEGHYCENDRLLVELATGVGHLEFSIRKPNRAWDSTTSTTESAIENFDYPTRAVNE